MKRLLLLAILSAIPVFGQTQRSTNFVATNDIKALTFTSQAGAPAGSGVIRLGNGELIAWEASPAGTDLTLTVNSAEQFVFSAAILSPTFITPAIGTPSSGVGTNITNVNAATLGGATFAAPGPIGGGTPSTGAFTTITATGSVTTGTGSGVGGTLTLTEGTAPSLTANAFSIYAPTDVAAGGLAYVTPGAAASGLMKATNSSGVMTITHDGGTSPDITTSITTPSTTFALFNATATTINAFGAATTVNTGASATQIWNFGGSTTASQFRFLEPSGSGTNYSGFKAVAQGASIDYSLPPTVGSAGSVLTDAAGNGVLTWGVGGAALTSTYVGYGASSVLSGEAAFIYTAASNILTVGGVSLGAGSEVSTIGPLVDAVDGTTPLNNINQVVAAGTAYTMTASYASLDFGTTDPVLTIANAGTYAIYVDVQFNLVGATYATYDSVSVKLRRTNNTAADLTGSTFGTFIPTITTITAVGPYLHIGPIKYQTNNTDDSITVQAILGSTPSVGSVTATAATITAIRAY